MAIAPLTREHAVDICSWRYPAPYACYDMTEADPDELLLPELGFHSLLAGDRLIGFRSFGPDGRVPGWEYDDQALDTGGALRPSSSARAWAVQPFRSAWPSGAQSSRRQRSG